MKRQNSTLTFSHCLRTAWAVCKLQAAMKTGAVEFSFLKIEGETRLAVGTLDPSRFNYTAKTETKREKSPAIVTYFDLEKNGFRSFRAELFLGWAA